MQLHHGQREKQQSGHDSPAAAKGWFIHRVIAFTQVSLLVDGQSLHGTERFLHSSQSGLL
jgi:hypothetical protein